MHPNLCPKIRQLVYAPGNVGYTMPLANFVFSERSESSPNPGTYSARSAIVLDTPELRRSSLKEENPSSPRPLPAYPFLVPSVWFSFDLEIDVQLVQNRLNWITKGDSFAGLILTHCAPGTH